MNISANIADNNKLPTIFILMSFNKKGIVSVAMFYFLQSTTYAVLKNIYFYNSLFWYDLFLPITLVFASCLVGKTVTISSIIDTMPIVEK